MARNLPTGPHPGRATYLSRIGRPDSFFNMYLNKKNSGTTRGGFRHYDGEQHEAACYLAEDSGAGLKLWEAVMHKAKVSRARQIKVTSALCRQFALDPKAKKRALTLWAAWGVFIIEQHVGKNPVVHIAAVPGRIARSRA